MGASGRGVTVTYNLFSSRMYQTLANDGQQLSVICNVELLCDCVCERVCARVCVCARACVCVCRVLLVSLLLAGQYRQNI